MGCAWTGGTSCWSAAGSANGAALTAIQRLHTLLEGQSARDQEGTRQRIAEFVRTLRQGGVFGQYDPDRGFIEEKTGKQPRRKQS